MLPPPPSRLTRIRRKCWYTIRSITAHIVHPKSTTCLECGFLAIDGDAVKEAFRIQLQLKGIAGCPPVEELRCIKSLWVDYDLHYAAPDAEAIFNELLKRRRPCKGFFPYESPYSPDKHLELQKAEQQRRDNLRDKLKQRLGETITEKSVIFVLGAIIGSATIWFAWLKHLLR